MLITDVSYAFDALGVSHLAGLEEWRVRTEWNLNTRSLTFTDAQGNNGVTIAAGTTLPSRVRNSSGAM